MSCPFGRAEAREPASLAIGADDPILPRHRPFRKILDPVEDELGTVVGMDPFAERLAVGQEVLFQTDDLPDPVRVPGNAGVRVERPDAETGAGDRQLELALRLSELFLGCRGVRPVTYIGREDPSVADLDLENAQLDRDQAAILACSLSLDPLADDLRRTAGQIGLEAAGMRFAQMGRNDQVRDRPTDRFIARETEKRFRCRVPSDQPSLFVDDNQAVERRADGRRLDRLQIRRCEHRPSPWLG